MRLSLSKKVFLVFALLTSLSLLVGGIVLVALNNFRSLQEKGDKIIEFRVQAKNMHSLQREVVLKQTSQKEAEMGLMLTSVESLAADIDRMLAEHSLAEHGEIGSLIDQVDYYRQAFLELSRLYKKDRGFLHGNNELIEIIEKRVRYYSQEVQLQIQPIIIALLQLQTKMHEDRSGESIGQMKSHEKRVAGIIADPLLGRGVHQLILNIEENYVNYLAIKDRETFLTETAANFERISQLSSAAVMEELQQTNKRLGIITIFFLVLIVFVTLVLWWVSSAYFNRYVRGLGLAVGAIRAGHFDFEPQETSKDELGEQILFVKEVALNLKEKISLLAASEEQFRGFVENISDWIWSFDQHGICHYCSPKSLDVMGVAADKIVGRSLKEIIGSGRKTGDEDRLLDCIKNNKPFDELAHGVVSEAGVSVEVESTGRPVVGDGGIFQGYRFVSRDIRERRKNEERTRKQAMEQQFLNQILGLSLTESGLGELFSRFIGIVFDSTWLDLEQSGAIFLVDKERRVLELHTHRGLAPQLQKNCKNVPFGVCLCGKAAESGKVVFCNQVDERHEIGYEGMHMHGHYCVPIHSVAGEVIGVFTVYVQEGSPINPSVESTLSSAATILGGIIKRRQAEEELSQMNLALEHLVEERTAQLSAANKELDTFAYSVSHDLRAPLRAIDGFSLAILEDCQGMLDDAGKRYLDRVRNGCQKMGQLIEDILHLSRLTRNPVVRKSVNLSAMAWEVVEVLQQGDKNREVEWQIAKNLQVEADPVMIRAVLDNLLGNAWKFTAKAEHATIQLSSTEMKGREVFFVKDNGAGFDMRYKEKLFTAFQRLHPSEEFEGTGIGLATVQRIIHRHGGEIWAESEEGKGAVFSFCL